MNKKKIIILSVVLVLLVALLVVVMNLPDKNQPDSDGDISHSGDNSYSTEAIYTTSTDSITDISFAVSGESYTLSKKDGKWICPEKPGVEISQSAVVSILSSLCSVSFSDSITDGSVSADDCGINEASDTVSFNSDLGQITLTCGNKVSDSELCYLKTSLSDVIYMITQSTADSVFVPFANFRSDTIRRVDFENLQKIELVNANCSVSLEKGEYNLDKGLYYSWRMTSPIKLLARDDEIKSKITEPVSKFELSDAVSDSGDFENYGLSAKDKYVFLADSNGKTQTVYFSDRINNNYYICVDADASIYEISASSAPFASVSVIDICDRQIYLTKQANLKSVVISGTSDYTIDFSNDAYVSVNGRKKDSETDMRNIFSSVCGLLADDISTAPMGDTVLTISYNKKDGTSTVVEFSEADDRYYYASKDGAPLYKILKSKIESVFKTLDK